MNLIAIKEIRTLNEAQQVRKIRNANYKYMTNHRVPITEEQQKDWWFNMDREIDKCYLLTVGEHGSVIYQAGYALIRYRGGKAYLTGALDKQVRGNGFGKKLFEFMINEAKKKTDDIRIEVLDSNAVAKSLYKKLGFTEYGRKGEVIKMKLESRK